MQIAVILLHYLLHSYNKYDRILFGRRGGGIGRRCGLKIRWREPPCRFESDPRHQMEIKSDLLKIYALRGGAVWQLVGLITQRSQVQILPPLPEINKNIFKNSWLRHASERFFVNTLILNKLTKIAKTQDDEDKQIIKSKVRVISLYVL
ncbi:MAG: hypothetical protein PWQ33_1658 [Pseudothermotoga sp.]|nr:hypothetical protein [Pseudothermotoga sp.]